MTITLAGIYVCTSKGMPMKLVSEAEILEGLGIKGDRYQTRTGAYTNKPTMRQVSVISEEAIRLANTRSGEEYLPHLTRRNLVLAGIGPEQLNLLATGAFSINGVRFIGTELCTPCDRPAKLSSQKDFKRMFEGLGGIRVAALDSGIIRVGERVLIFSA